MKRGKQSLKEKGKKEKRKERKEDLSICAMVGTIAISSKSQPLHYYDVSAVTEPFLSFTPPTHLPSFFSHSTPPKVVVRRMLTLKDDSFGQESFVRACMSASMGNVWARTPERGFCT